MAYKVFAGDNASQLYMEALVRILQDGEEVSPRGTVRKEIQAVITYENPLIRTTFLKGRTINPFFQLAESFWIACGRADVEFLLHYNKGMQEFSDDGINFHAPYGERLRKWNHSEEMAFTFCPHDQLLDVVLKFQQDMHTSQAVACIWNPHFDNREYKGKDFPCNDLLKFKIRDGKLNLTVNNRSNDLHWGTFGANLCQFATIQELVASWLKIPVGEYNQESDSLHIYTQDYGHKITQSVMDAYAEETADASGVPEVKQFSFPSEPRITCTYKEFGEIQKKWEQVEKTIHKFDEIDATRANLLLQYLLEVKDPYFRMTFVAMYAYQAYKYGSIILTTRALEYIPDCSWKVSMLYFLYPKYEGMGLFRDLYSRMPQDVQDYIEHK